MRLKQNILFYKYHKYKEHKKKQNKKKTSIGSILLVVKYKEAIIRIIQATRTCHYVYEGNKNAQVHNSTCVGIIMLLRASYSSLEIKMATLQHKQIYTHTAGNSVAPAHKF